MSFNPLKYQFKRFKINYNHSVFASITTIPLVISAKPCNQGQLEIIGIDLYIYRGPQIYSEFCQFMSYKHNNLMAMRQSWWDDQSTPSVAAEKQFLQQTLSEKGVYATPSLDDVKYFFFSLPSIIIVKGYALGFTNQLVKDMINQHIEINRHTLSARNQIKIQFRM